MGKMGKEDAVMKIKNIPLSNSTINRQIDDNLHV